MAVWVFGYGSLIWRPGFSFEERRAAWVSGFARRLHQGSPDHRGTPERLGRVVTLVSAEGERCGGVCYRLHDDHAAQILADLDVREQGGYERLALTAALSTNQRLDGPTVEVAATTWVASPGNEYHLGDASVDEMAAQIRDARGPSGTNLEYVLALERALALLGCEDAHVTSIVRALASPNLVQARRD